VSGNAPAYRFPKDKRADAAKARRLAWWTIAYLISAIAFMSLVFTSSQAMKTVWLEDILSLAPPILFLLGGYFAQRPPDRTYPFGYYRIVSTAYLAASVALLGMGGYLAIDAAIKLVTGEHPSIGGIELFGSVIWLGWLMLPPLLWSAIPAVFLGRAKLKLADSLHDKVLLADAEMNRADWLTALAGMAGIFGIAFGYWWADSAAGALISLDIIKDGVKHVRAAAEDLVNRRPQRLTALDLDPIPEKLTERLKRLDWVSDAVVRVREDGNFFVGDAFIVPRDDRELPRRIEAACREACDSDWRLRELMIMPVRELPAFGD